MGPGIVVRALRPPLLWSNEADGATKTVNLGFQTRIVFVFASMEVLFGGSYHGFTSQGFADTESGSAGFAVGQYVIRAASGATTSTHSEPATGRRRCCRGFWGNPSLTEPRTGRVLPKTLG